MAGRGQMSQPRVTLIGAARCWARPRASPVQKKNLMPIFLPNEQAPTPPPPPQTNIVRLKKNVDNWRRPLTRKYQASASPRSDIFRYQTKVCYKLDIDLRFAACSLRSPERHQAKQPQTWFASLVKSVVHDRQVQLNTFYWGLVLYSINPLSAKASFQLWYPGGQRLKVISFSSSGVKSPSKCFSNTEPTKIIASRDEKWCNVPVQWAQIGALKFVTPQSSTLEMSRTTAFLRFPRAAAWPSYSCTSTYRGTEKCKAVATSGLGNRLLKTRWFVNDEGLRLRAIRRWLPCAFFLFRRWITEHDSYQSRRRPMVLLRSISPTPEVKFSF